MSLSILYCFDTQITQNLLRNLTYAYTLCDLVSVAEQDPILEHLIFML